MSKTDEIRAAAQKIKANAQETISTVTDHSVTRSGPVKPRVKPVRRTVDLSPIRHSELDSWCTETARMIGRARVTGQDVMRTLVARLLTDETLARKIRQDLTELQ